MPLPYAPAGVQNGKATSTCPTCGHVSEGADHKASARAYAEHHETAHATASTVRSYVVGLPVVITVHDDGTVTAEVDLSEASDLGDASVPDGQDDSDERVRADERLVEDAVVQALVKVSI